MKFNLFSLSTKEAANSNTIIKSRDSSYNNLLFNLEVPKAVLGHTHYLILHGGKDTGFLMYYAILLLAREAVTLILFPEAVRRN